VKDKDLKKKCKPRPDNLLEWQTWLEQELKPPLNPFVRSSPEVRRVLRAFLKVLVYVRRSQDVTTFSTPASGKPTDLQRSCIFAQKHKTNPQFPILQKRTSTARK
jgi:hypothetical protein